MPPSNAEARDNEHPERRRRSTRSADHEAMVCVTANAMTPSTISLTGDIRRPPDARRRKPHAIDEAEGHHRRPDHECQAPQLEPVIEQRAGEQPEHHHLPVDSAISGACEMEIGDVEPIEELTACAADPNANAAASRPARTVPKPRNSDAASTNSSATVAPRKAISRVESSINSAQAARQAHAFEFNADRRPI